MTTAQPGPSGVLGHCPRPLVEEYDLAMLDLDGVVYVSGHAVEGAADRLARVRAAGMHLAFITNNASRTPEAVAEHLRELGVEADPADVVTSAQAAARLLVERFGPGAPVLALGGAGLDAALRAEGLVPVAAGDGPPPVALATGYGPQVVWRDIMRAAVLVREGLPWVASNSDLTIPTDFGLAPGHGVLVDMLQRFTGTTAVVAGKPERPLLDETVRRVGGRRPLMVGDRMDTDIEGAHAAGFDSLLVLTGVSGLTELAAADRAHRPTYLSPGLEGLLGPHPVPEPAGGGFRAGGWTAVAEGGRLQVSGSGEPADWWRVVAASCWDWLDRRGTPVDVTGLDPPLPAARGRGG